MLAAAAWVATWLTSISMLGGLAPPREEGGVLELTQAAVLGTAVLLSAVAAVRLPAGPARAWSALLCLLALLAYAREADFHIVLNPRYLGAWGLRYRLDWWLSGEVALSVKLAWAVALATPVALFGWLYYASGVHPLRALWERRPVAKAMLACVGLYVVGYALDDVLGRGQFLPTWVTMPAEELAELGAALVLLVLCSPGTEGKFGRA